MLTKTAVLESTKHANVFLSKNIVSRTADQKGRHVNYVVATYYELLIITVLSYYGLVVPRKTVQRNERVKKVRFYCILQTTKQ